MGTLYLTRDAYATSGESFSGIPPTILEGDVAPDAKIVFTADIRESNISELRPALMEANGFTGHLVYSIGGDDYGFKFRAARLVAPLEPRDWNTNLLHVVWEVERSNITDLVRPRGRPVPDASAFWGDALYAFSVQKDHLRRKHAELQQFENEVEQRRQMLTEADQALAERRATLWQGATPEMIAGAEARGL